MCYDNNKTDKLREAAKNVFFFSVAMATKTLLPPLSSLVTTTFFPDFFSSFKKVIFFQWLCLSPSPLSGRANKKMTFLLLSLLSLIQYNTFWQFPDDILHLEHVDVEYGAVAEGQVDQAQGKPFLKHNGVTWSLCSGIVLKLRPRVLKDFINSALRQPHKKFFF